MMKRSTINPIHAIVPVKAPSLSKTRLSGRLSSDERACLTVTMLLNVLTALRKTSSILSTTVVCADRRLRLLVEKYGATFLWEGRCRGLNRALNYAMKKAPSYSAILIIHADLPLLRSDDVDDLAIRAHGYPLVFVPSKDKTGTNAILMQSRNMIRLAFGEGSFRKHVILARKSRIAYRAIQIQGVSFDVDEEQDLDELMRNLSSPMRSQRGLFGFEYGKPLSPILVPPN